MATTNPLPFGIDRNEYMNRRQEAQFCYFYYYWTGNDIMFMTGYALRECKVSGKISSWTFGVEVNPKGPTAFEQWRQECWNYIPDGHFCSLEELAAMPNTSWAHLTVEQLQKRFEQEKERLAYMRNYYSQRPLLRDYHWAYGSHGDVKRYNRKKWRQWYALRKAYKQITNQEYFQWSLRGYSPA